jgi:hypothetical protein
VKVREQVSELNIKLQKLELQMAAKLSEMQGTVDEFNIRVKGTQSFVE